MTDTDTAEVETTPRSLPPATFAPFTTAQLEAEITRRKRNDENASYARRLLDIVTARRLLDIVTAEPRIDITDCRAIASAADSKTPLRRGYSLYPVVVTAIAKALRDHITELEAGA